MSSNFPIESDFDWRPEYSPDNIYHLSWRQPNQSGSNQTNMGLRNSKPPPPPPAPILLQPPLLPQPTPSSPRAELAPQYLHATNGATQPASRMTSVSPTNLLSSQTFKDELKLQQSRLSPILDQSQKPTIDERIRMRREAELRARTSSSPVTSHEPTSSPASQDLRIVGPSQADKLPDKLLATSSTLQRDKRPFAYSPDVSDPNNRGKLDLSHIKSSTMRKRLLANMEASSSSDDADEQVVECHRPEPTIIDNEIRDSLSNNVTTNADESSRLTSQPSFGAPDSRQRLDRQSNMQQPTSTGFVHYSAEPPRFYDMNQSNPNANANWIQQPRAAPTTSFLQDPQQSSRRRHEEYLTNLNAEIAESLDSLSFLANNLDHLTTHRHHQSTSRPYMSTFLSSSVSPTNTNGHYDHRPPRFYSVLPSGRPVPEYSIDMRDGKPFPSLG